MNTWTLYINGVAVESFNNEKKAWDAKSKKELEYALKGKYSSSTFDLLYDAKVKRFFVTNVGDAWYVNIINKPYICVGVAYSKEDAEKHCAWCEIHHSSIDLHK